MANKNYGLLRKDFGLVRALGDEFLRACERKKMPIEALYGLVTPKGRETVEEAVQLIIDRWHAGLPELASQHAPTGGHPFCGTLMTDARNVIEVPDLDATDLTALTEWHCDLTFLGGDYRRWDFWKGCLDGKPISGRGKRFEWDLWKPGREASSDEVRSYFEAKGFDGHVGAFTQWRRICGLKGHYASIPEDNGCWRYSDGRLYAPCCFFDDSRRELNRGWIGIPWEDYWSFVGFRELP